MADYDRFAWGGVDYPLDADSSNGLLQDSDPGIYWAQQFFAGVIQHYLGERLTAAARAAGAAIPSAVAAVSNVDPAPYLAQDPRKRYPLLALYRTTAKYDARTTVWSEELSRWEIAYVLPALNWDQAEKLVPAFASVSRIIERACRQGYDPSVQDGRMYWGDEFARIEKVTLIEGRYGRFQDAEGLVYHAWMGILDARERERAAEPSNFEAFAGADIHEDIVDADGTTVTDVVVMASPETPTFTSVTASTGTSAGGQTITVAGTLFRPGAQVFLGDQECTAVIVASALSLTCTTPPHAAGLVDLTVTNPDGETVTATGAFTFT